MRNCRPFAKRRDDFNCSQLPQFDALKNLSRIMSESHGIAVKKMVRTAVASVVGDVILSSSAVKSPEASAAERTSDPAG